MGLCTLVQSQAHVFVNMSHLYVAFSAVSWQPELKEESEKSWLHALNHSYFHRGSARNLVGRRFIEPQLGPGIACPLLQARGTRAAATRDAECLFRLPESLPPLLQRCSAWSLMKMRSLDQSRYKGIEAQRDDLKPEKGAVCSPERLPGPSDGGKKAKWSQLAGSYDRKENSPS